MPDSDGDAPATHPYTARMNPKTAALFDLMSGDADLAFEIKILRAYLAELADDLQQNHRQIVQIMTLLIRAVQVHAKLVAGVTELEQILRETAAQALAEMAESDE